MSSQIFEPDSVGAESAGGEATPHKPFAGMLVVALEQAVAAPFCSSRLADGGARVIKVERPEGDFARAYDRVVHGQSSFFTWLNRGKESLVVNLEDEADRALLERVVARADVFLQNLKPGSAARFGFGAERLRERHPRLVTCDISGYGDDGPYATMKAYDMLVQAESGLCSISGSPEQPGRLGVSGCDIACGMFAYMGIVESLVLRERTGTGRAVATSLFESMADWMNVPLMMYEHGGAGPARTGLRHPLIQPYGAYQTRGGPPILISVQNEREYRRLCEDVLERPDFLTDPRFRDNPARVENVEALTDAIDAAFTSLPREELVRRLRNAQIAFGEVNGVAELARHPALRRMQVTTPWGPVEMVAPPVRVRGAPDPSSPRYGPVPALDEHGAAIRAEFSP